MKEMRVFIGSSKELEEERKYLAYLTILLHDAFRRRNLRVTLTKWEYLDPTFTSAKTENRYIDRMKDSDLALIIYWKRLGKYTKEEDKIARESTPLDNFRLARRFVLFKEYFDQENSCSEELDSYKKSMKGEQSNQCGSFLNHAGLGVHFLHQIDMFRHDGEPLLRVENGKIKCDDLELADLSECPETLLNEIGRLPVERFPLRESEVVDGKTIKVFLSAEEDELTDVRNSLADMAFELNDIWQVKGLPQRLEMRFYSSAMKEELLKNSDIALIIYRSTIGIFDSDAVKEAYDCFGREDTKKCYVFFQDVPEGLTEDFKAFKKSFSKEWGQFVCAFQNTDTIRYKFAIQLSPDQLELDQTRKTVHLGDYAVASLDRLPMYVNNKLIQNNKERWILLKKEQEACRAQHDDDSPEQAKKEIELDRQLKQCEKQLSEYEHNLFEMSREIAQLKSQRFASRIQGLESLLDQGDEAGVRECLDKISLSKEAKDILDKQQQADAELRNDLVLLHKIFSLKVKAELNNSEVSNAERCEEVCRLYEQQIGLYRDGNDHCIFEEFQARTLTEFAAFCRGYDILLIPSRRKKFDELFKAAAAEWENLKKHKHAEKDASARVEYTCQAADACRMYVRSDLSKAKDLDSHIDSLRQLLNKEGLTDEQRTKIEGCLANSIQITARLSMRKKDFKTAEKKLKEALALCQRNSRSYASILSDLASVHSNICPQKAEKEYLEVITVCKLFCPAFLWKIQKESSLYTERFTLMPPEMFGKPEDIHLMEEQLPQPRDSKDSAKGRETVDPSKPSYSMEDLKRQIPPSDKIHLIEAIGNLGGFYCDTKRFELGIQKFQEAASIASCLLEEDSELYYDILAKLYGTWAGVMTAPDLYGYSVITFFKSDLSEETSKRGMEASEIENFFFLAERMLKKLNEIYPHQYSETLCQLYHGYNLFYFKLQQHQIGRRPFYKAYYMRCLSDYCRYMREYLQSHKVSWLGKKISAYLELFFYKAAAARIKKDLISRAGWSEEYIEDMCCRNFEIRKCLSFVEYENYSSIDTLLRYLDQAETMAKELAAKYPDERNYFLQLQVAIQLRKVKLFYCLGRLADAEETARECVAFCREKKEDLDCMRADALHKYADILCSEWHNEGTPSKEYDWPSSFYTIRSFTDCDFTFLSGGCSRPRIGWIEHQRSQEAFVCYLEALELYTHLNRTEEQESLILYLTRFFPEEMRKCEDDPKIVLPLVYYDIIADMYLVQQKYDQALEYFRKVLEIRQQSLGENHADTARNYNDIGYVWHDKRDYDQALKNYQKALAIRLQILGENHAETAQSYNNIGAAFFDQGNYPGALENHRKALEIRLKVFLEQHPEVARSYNHLGKTYAELGDLQASEENFRKAYEIAKANPEDDFCAELIEDLSYLEEQEK